MKEFAQFVNQHIAEMPWCGHESEIDKALARTDVRHFARKVSTRFHLTPRDELAEEYDLPACLRREPQDEEPIEPGGTLMNIAKGIGLLLLVIALITACVAAGVALAVGGGAF